MALLVLLLAACGGDGNVVDPPPPDSTDNGGGTVQRAALSLTAALAGPDAGVGAILGWPSNRVPAATITIERTSGGSPIAAETDAQGQVTFSDLLPGTYRISIGRLLQPEERQALSGSPAYADIDAFGGGGSAAVEAPSTSASLDVIAGRRGSLVFSEYFMKSGRSETSLYKFGHFLELYNNSDSTIYMDGRVLAAGFWNIERRPERSCAVLESWRTETRGVWSNRHIQFPGSGTQYPVRPGETVVLATDAIDHREFFTGMPDLSRANFESVSPGGGDVDNPLVPNVRDVSPGRFWEDPVEPHGWNLGDPWLTLLLTDPLDVQALEVADLPVPGEPRHRLIPRDRIIEAATHLYPESGLTFADGYCHPVIDPSFDRQPSSLWGSDWPALTSLHRRSLTSLDGRVILRRTGTSAADFMLSAQTPGRP